MSDQIALPDDLPFASLVSNPSELRQVAQRFMDVIWTSFGRDAAINLAPARVTLSATKERFVICEKWFRVMRKDLHYSLQKALDLLPVALYSELAGVSWTPPPAEQGWVVPGAAKPMVADPRERIDTTPDGDDEPEL